MRRTMLLLLVLGALAAPLAAAAPKILLVARDRENRALPGLRFTSEGLETAATNKAGAAELQVSPRLQPGDKLSILLIPSGKKSDDWFLLGSEVVVPKPDLSAVLVLMRKSELRQIAAEVRDAPRAANQTKETSEEDRRRILIEAAARRGLTEDQLETAIRSFGETQDPRDKGIAAFLAGQYASAETLLEGVREKQRRDYLEVLRYLGASQDSLGKYSAAAATFREALTLQKDDTTLLSALGEALLGAALWAEAERAFRRALLLDQERLGPNHPKVAVDLNDLAALLLATQRPAEAEPLMKRALAIDEARLGPSHVDVATDLNNLALLLQTTDRLDEAEPLLRRALDINEHSLGAEHAKVATALNNLAQLLRTTGRLTEAEPLMERALAIDEKNLGPTHPKVGTRLGNLAMLLWTLERYSEALPLLRRALDIDEASLGPHHPRVVSDISNLAQLLWATNRPDEAEPLMRRALAIDEAVLGPKDPSVARDLNNLAQFLQASNRLGEAEPLQRRALAIDEAFFGPEHPQVANRLHSLSVLLQTGQCLQEAALLERRALEILGGVERRTGVENPNRDAFSRTYRSILQDLGRSDSEIEKDLNSLAIPKPRD